MRVPLSSWDGLDGSMSGVTKTAGESDTQTSADITARVVSLFRILSVSILSAIRILSGLFDKKRCLFVRPDKDETELSGRVFQNCTDVHNGDLEIPYL